MYVLHRLCIIKLISITLINDTLSPGVGTRVTATSLFEKSCDKLSSKEVETMTGSSQLISITLINDTLWPGVGTGVTAISLFEKEAIERRYLR
jgi:hypothetical protein